MIRARAVDRAGEREVGADGVGERERQVVRMATSMSKVSSIRPSAVRLPVPKSSVERGEVDGAAADRHRRRRAQRRRHALLAQAERVEARREAVVEPLQLAREIGERADRETAVGRELHRRRVGLRRLRAERGDLDAAERRGRSTSSVPLTSGRPSASLTLALSVEPAEAGLADRDVPRLRREGRRPGRRRRRRG